MINFNQVTFPLLKCTNSNNEHVFFILCTNLQCFHLKMSAIILIQKCWYSFRGNKVNIYYYFV